MPRPKERPTFIKSLRVDTNTKLFLESIENYNQFVIQILQETPEYKKFLQALRDKEDQNQPRLFD